MQIFFLVVLSLNVLLFTRCSARFLGSTKPSAPAQTTPVVPQSSPTLPNTPHVSILDEVAPPAGPADFKIDSGIMQIPIPKEESLMFACSVLGQLSVEDFNGRVRYRRLTLFDPKHPSFELVVTSESPTPLLRKYVMWGIASIMEHMVENEFSANTFELMWEGAKIGDIDWNLLDTDNGGHLNGSSKAETWTLPLSNFTRSSAISAGVNAPYWGYNYYGYLLDSKDVFMATIASLVQAAQLPSHNVDSFLGYWPGKYNARQYWKAEAQPSALSKTYLLYSILGSVVFAYKDTNYHEMVMNFSLDGVLVARGGHSIINPPAPTPTPPVAATA